MADETTEGGTAAPPADDNWIPRSRLNEEIAKRRDLEVKLAAAQEDVGKLAPALERIASLEGAVKSAETRRAEDLALYRAGIDDDAGADVARLLWSALPEEGRPSLVDQVAKWKEAPPRPLQAYFTKPAAVDPAPPGLPRANAGTRPAGDPGATSNFDTSAIASMSDEQFRAALPDILRDIRQGSR